MNNFTDDSWLQDDYNLCNTVTNHWLYFIFTGYLLPLVSPRVRNWFKEFINSSINNKVTGQIVTLTEYGFDKIQEIEDNKEMKDYIRRLCKSKNSKLIYTEESLEKLAWLFSGERDINKFSSTGIQQSWKKLNKIINKGKYGIKIERP